MTNFRTMIVPAALVETVRELAATWAGGVGMFITPLAPPLEPVVYPPAPEDPDEPAPYIEPPAPPVPTHYISTGLIDAEIAAVMPWTEYGSDEPVTHPGNPEALAAMLHEQHPEATPEQLEGIIAACDISTQEPHTAANRMGLKILA
jgi:hypothetical protein